MTPAELLRLRLRDQLLDRSMASTPAQVVARLAHGVITDAQRYARFVGRPLAAVRPGLPDNIR